MFEESRDRFVGLQSSEGHGVSELEISREPFKPGSLPALAYQGQVQIGNLGVSCGDGSQEDVDRLHPVEPRNANHSKDAVFTWRRTQQARDVDRVGNYFVRAGQAKPEERGLHELGDGQHHRGLGVHLACDRIPRRETVASGESPLKCVECSVTTYGSPRTRLNQGNIRAPLEK